jgi:hypothetical protein
VSMYNLDSHRHISTGFTNVTLNVTGSMTWRHTYVAETYVDAFTKANAVVANGFREDAYLHLAGQYGATLNWISV